MAACTTANDRCILTLPLSNIVAADGNNVFSIIPRQRTDPMDPLYDELAGYDITLSALYPWFIVAGASAIQFDGGNSFVQSRFSFVVMPGGGTDTLPEILLCPNGICADPIVVLRGRYASFLPGLLAVTAGTVYALDGSSGDLLACPETSCSSPTTVAAGLYPNLAAADSTGVYVLASGDLYAASAASGAAKIASGLSGFAVALDGTRVFVVSQHSIVTCPESSSTCSPTTYWMTADDLISAPYIDHQYLYWRNGAGDVMRCPLAACTTPELFYPCGHPPQLGAMQLVGTADWIYCTGSTGVLRVPKVPG